MTVLNNNMDFYLGRGFRSSEGEPLSSIQNVPVYNEVGTVEGVLTLPEPVSWIQGRLGVGDSGKFYKGIGTQYFCHFSFNVPIYTGYPQFGCFPYGVPVVNPFWEGKYGIFNASCWSAINEMIGSCGRRENNIIQNSLLCDRSDVTVIDKVSYPFVAEHWYYVLLYKDGRIPFLGHGKPKDLLDLLEFMLAEDWNFPWDKPSIRDISCSGNITDVAELFKSVDLVHKYGTVFSFIKSLESLAPAQFLELVDYLGLDYIPTKSFLLPFLGSGVATDSCWMVCGNIMGMNSIDINSYGELDMIKTYLISGRNCGNILGEDFQDIVRQHYLRRIENHLVGVRNC